MFDHDVIDEGPATRFTRRLVELIESAYGLCEQDIQAVNIQLPQKDEQP
jgi:hypothetical protein